MAPMVLIMALKAFAPKPERRLRNPSPPARFRAFTLILQCKTQTLGRGGRVVECTALEMRHTREGIEGSNPSLSANCY